MFFLVYFVIFLFVYGLSILCPLFSSFLCNKKIGVLLDGCASETFIIDAGVPQGSVVEPTLLLLNILTFTMTDQITLCTFP